MENPDGKNVSAHLHTYAVLLTVPFFKFCWLVLVYHPASLLHVPAAVQFKPQRRILPVTLAAATAAVLSKFYFFLLTELK